MVNILLKKKIKVKREEEEKEKKKGRKESLKNKLSRIMHWKIDSVLWINNRQ